VTKVLSTEEVKRATEGPGKDFGKSILKGVTYKCHTNMQGCYAPLRHFVIMIYYTILFQTNSIGGPLNVVNNINTAVIFLKPGSHWS
jgi:hypothetical protein